MNTQQPDLTPTPRRTVLIEDALVLLALGSLWLVIAGQKGPLANAALGLSLLLMVAVYVRRKRRVDRLFAELKRQQEEARSQGGYPPIPGMMPPGMMPPGTRPGRMTGREGEGAEVQPLRANGRKKKR